MELTGALQKIFANQSLQGTDSEQESQKSKPIDDTEYELCMLKLWTVMTETFGYKWTKPMGDEPNQTWANGLRDLTIEQWRDGLTFLRGSVEEWPPSLPEFRRWCTNQMTKEQLKAHAEREAERIIGSKIGSYNPNVTPMSYQEAERAQSRLARQIFVMAQENDRRDSLGIERQTDPARICLDEDYL